MNAPKRLSWRWYWGIAAQRRWGMNLFQRFFWVSYWVLATKWHHVKCFWHFNPVMRSVRPLVQKAKEPSVADAVSRLAKNMRACRGCNRALLPGNRILADGCPCNSPRGVNHGLVHVLVCTCDSCDTDQTCTSRWPTSGVKE